MSKSTSASRMRLPPTEALRNELESLQLETSLDHRHAIVYLRLRLTARKAPTVSEPRYLAGDEAINRERAEWQTSSLTSGMILDMASEYAKISVSLPGALVERIKSKVGSRGVSRYVAEALEHEERLRALRDWLVDQDDQHGPIPDDVMREVRRQWLGADSAAG